MASSLTWLKDNPRIQGYVPNHLAQKFKGFAESSGLSESKALAFILQKFFELEEAESGEGPTPEAAISQHQIDEIAEAVSQKVIEAMAAGSSKVDPEAQVSTTVAQSQLAPRFEQPKTSQRLEPSQGSLGPGILLPGTSAFNQTQKPLTVDKSQLALRPEQPKTTQPLRRLQKSSKLQTLLPGTLSLSQKVLKEVEIKPSSPILLPQEKNSNAHPTDFLFGEYYAKLLSQKKHPSTGVFDRQKLEDIQILIPSIEKQIEFLEFLEKIRQVLPILNQLNEAFSDLVLPISSSQ